jgi:thiol-disulfide isomerase/thioredoxin
MRLYYKMHLKIDEHTRPEEAMKKAEKLKNGKWMIMYYAYWCPHCVTLKPTYDELASKCKMMGVKFAMVEASHLNNGMIENQHMVSSYPTLVTRTNNTDSNESYSGERSVDNLKKYLIHKLKLAQRKPRRVVTMRIPLKKHNKSNKKSSKKKSMKKLLKKLKSKKTKSNNN